MSRLNGLLDAYLHARVRHFHALEPELRIPAIRYDECFGDQFTRHDFLEFFHWCVYDRDRTATFVRGYVREVARLLSLHEDDVVSGYMRRFSGDV